MRFSTYKYSCIVDTPYSLFLYLLMCKNRDWERTIFFVGEGIADEYLEHLPKVIRFSSNYHDYATRWQLFRIKLRALYYRVRYINHTELFAHDHLVFSSQLVGRNKYTLIEDAPGFYSFYDDSPSWALIPIPKRPRPRIRRLLLWGPICGQTFGRNEYCINRWVTEENDVQSPLLKDRHFTLVKLNELWETASDEKKKYILSVFGINEDILHSLQHCKTIIFTEAFGEDGLNLDEAASIFVRYVKEYQSDGVMIKPHPRDNMNWSQVFPEAYILKTKVPMQILSIMGADFARAITVCSTAISSMKPETEIIWVSTAVHPKWAAKYGVGGKCPFEGKFKNIRYK